MKLSKAAVRFEAPAKGPHHCSQCRHFHPPDGSPCEVVSEKGPPDPGVIDGDDWCDRFLRRRTVLSRPAPRTALRASR